MKLRSSGTVKGTAQVVKLPSRASEARRGQAADVQAADAHESSSSRHDGTATSVDDTDDFHHRMWANAAALIFTVALIAAGVWLAVSIADMRKTQDCVLSGRRNCAPITTSPS